MKYYVGGGQIHISVLFSQVISSVRMCSSLLGIGFTLPTLHPSNLLIFRMMTPPISHFSSTLGEEGVVILHQRLVPYSFVYLSFYYH